VNDGTALIDRLQFEADQCLEKWQALATWPTREQNYQRYQAELAFNKTAKTKEQVVPADNPGPTPTAPDAADCAPASAFGLPAAVPPGQQPSTPASPTTPASSPSKAPTSKATPTVAPKSPVKVAPTSPATV
jgi:hypothetical protein